MGRHPGDPGRYTGPEDIQGLLDFLLENHDGRGIYGRLKRRLMLGFGLPITPLLGGGFEDLNDFLFTIFDESGRTGAGTLTPYNTAQRASRIRAVEITENALQMINGALDVWGTSLNEKIKRLASQVNEVGSGIIKAGRGRIDTTVEWSIAQLRRLERDQDAVTSSADFLNDHLENVIHDHRRLAFEDSLAMWRMAGHRAIVLGGAEGALGGVAAPNFTLATTYEALDGAAQHWKTRLRGYGTAAAEEADEIIRTALLKGLPMAELQKRLRPYVMGAEKFREAFPKSVVGNALDDIRLLKGPEREAARKIKRLADRIAYSEVWNAKAEAEIQHYVEDPIVKAIRWTLSRNRGALDGPDECDVLAKNDFYGMGKGVYPLDRVPFPPHPWDRCDRVPILFENEQIGDPKPGGIAPQIPKDGITLGSKAQLKGMTQNRARRAVEGALRNVRDSSAPHRKTIQQRLQDNQTARASLLLHPKMPDISEEGGARIPAKDIPDAFAAIEENLTGQLAALGPKHEEYAALVDKRLDMEHDMREVQQDRARVGQELAEAEAKEAEASVVTDLERPLPRTRKIDKEIKRLNDELFGIEQRSLALSEGLNRNKSLRGEWTNENTALKKQRDTILRSANAEFSKLLSAEVAGTVPRYKGEVFDPEELFREFDQEARLAVGRFEAAGEIQAWAAQNSDRAFENFVSEDGEFWEDLDGFERRKMLPKLAEELANDPDFPWTTETRNAWEEANIATKEEKQVWIEEQLFNMNDGYMFGESSVSTGFDQLLLIQAGKPPLAGPESHDQRDSTFLHGVRSEEAEKRSKTYKKEVARMRRNTNLGLSHLNRLIGEEWTLDSATGDGLTGEFEYPPLTVGYGLSDSFFGSDERDDPRGYYLAPNTHGSGEFGELHVGSMSGAMVSKRLLVDDFEPLIDREVTVVVHEMGHWMEDRFPEIMAKTVAWRDARIRETEPLDRKHPPYQLGPEWGADETGYQDRFRTPYIGKVMVGEMRHGSNVGTGNTGKRPTVAIQNSGTEVFSMGLVYMTNDPLSFYREDPGHFMLIYDILSAGPQDPWGERTVWPWTDLPEGS